MMKLIFWAILMFFIFVSGPIKVMQLVYQNMMYMMLFYILLMFPLMNLNMWGGMFYMSGMDIYSWGLILLSVWILSLMIMMSEPAILSCYWKYYLNLMNMMLVLLILCFSTMNLILFYIYFESSLIPVFLLILGWGHQVERIQAGFYMMLYTLFGSMPLFLIISYLYLSEYSLMMDMIILKDINFYIYMGLIMAFLIKMPMYLVHLWLPKAHVEAPVWGSMILAGVMLKLGSYGLMRCMLMMLMMCIKFNKFFIILSLMGGVISSVICLCQIDMKMLVAYSSVVHMSILMSGVMTLFNWGYLGGFMMMIAHGLCSSGLFCLVNLNYERFMSRSLYINKGGINFLPSLSLLWFLLCSSNLSFPPSLNLFSEIMLINSLLIWSKILILMLMMISFFSALYTLYLYSYSQHGKIYEGGGSFKGVKVAEFMILLLHWLPLNLLFFFMVIFM